MYSLKCIDQSSSKTIALNGAKTTNVKFQVIIIITIKLYYFMLVLYMYKHLPHFNFS